MSASDPGEGQGLPEPRPQPAFGTGDPEQFLRFYDRLRSRIAARLAGKVGTTLTDTLLLAPDLFILMVRLFMDTTLPGGSRSLVGGALGYFLLPADLMPELFLGPGGFVDDVVLAAAVLSHVFSRDLRPYVERHWSGPGNVHDALENAVRAGEALLPSRLYDRLASVLARRGVDLGPAGRPPSYASDAPTTDDETYDYSRVT